jgi:Protein of unknown function (DUF3822)
MTLPQITDTRFLDTMLASLEASVVVESKHFDIARLPSYHLCIEVGDNRFRFCVTDALKRCLWLEDYSLGTLFTEPQLLASLHLLYKQHKFLALNNWKHISVSFNSPYFTLIPDDFFRKEYTSSYLSTIRGNALRSQEVALSQHITSIGAYNTFVADRAVWDWMLNTYSMHNPEAVHQTTALINGCMAQSNTKAPTVLLYFEDDYLTIAVTEQKKLLLCNKFSYKVAQDMGYFVLFVLTNLKLKPSEVSCVLYGEITPYSEDYQWLQRFLPDLVLGQNPKSISFGEEFDDLLEHRYYSLYTACL